MQGEPRLLLFSPDSRTLFFTTTLGPSIQAYCIPTGDILVPPQVHPSPPNVLTLSADGTLLLSSSPRPPTVRIQHLTSGSGATSFHPADTSSPAVAAAFPPQADLTGSSGVAFALGFQDGTISLYRLAVPTRRLPYFAQHRPQQPVLVGSLLKLHNACMGGVTAVDFIPGYKARVVSVGHDGRCRLADFAAGPRVLRT